MSSVDQQVIRRVVKRLILNDMDYRQEIIDIISEDFMRHSIGFFKCVANAKMDYETITADWYKKTFIDDESDTNLVALNAGINMKTVQNMFDSKKKEVVIQASNQNYHFMRSLIEELTYDTDEVDFTISIKIGKVSVELNISETLIVINALAVRRAAMRGGVWSRVGKRAEKMLMETLCHLYSVDRSNWDIEQKSEDGSATFEREIDFFLVSGETRHKCEVKLMGRGNPESADAVVARESRVFIADTLLLNTKNQLDVKNVLWVALKEHNGYQRFEKVLQELAIPCTAPDENTLSEEIDAFLQMYKME